MNKRNVMLGKAIDLIHRQKKFGNKIEDNPYTKGLMCVFYFAGIPYYASLCNIKGYFNECMIFKCKEENGKLDIANDSDEDSNMWRGLDVTKENLTNCINEFVKKKAKELFKERK